MKTRNKIMRPDIAKDIKKNYEQYTLAEFLLALRKCYGYSRNYVGDIIGRSGQSILTVEHKGHVPRLDALIGFAKLYEVPPELLFKIMIKDYDRRS